MDTTYYIVKYKYFSDNWGVRSIKEGEIKFESLPKMYGYIAENFEEKQIISIQQVQVQELDVKKNYMLAKQSFSYKVELRGFCFLTKHVDSYKELVKFVENVPLGLEVKRITDPYGNDLTCALVKKEQG